MCLAGPAAERYFVGPITDGGDQPDIQMARGYLSQRFDPLTVGAEIVQLRDAADPLVRTEWGATPHPCGRRRAARDRRYDRRRCPNAASRHRGPSKNSPPASWCAITTGQVLAYCLFRGRAGTKIGGEAADA